MKTKVFSVLLFLSPSLFAAKPAEPLSCVTTEGKQRTEIRVQDRNNAQLLIRNERGVYTCDLRVMSVQDMRRGMRPMIRVVFERTVQCDPPQLDQEAKLVQMPQMDIDISEGVENPKAIRLAAYRRSGFHPCEFKNFRLQTFGLGKESENRTPRTTAKPPRSNANR
jgi:hypothetical protein